MTDGRPDRRIITNPCNQAAEINNLAAIQEALGDLYNNVENINEIINIEEIVNNFGGDGDDVFPFRITASSSTTSATAQNLDTGESMTVIDWTTRNLFGCNFAVGNEGWAVRRDPAEDGTPSSTGDIIVLEGFARWVVVTLLGPLSSGTASGTTGTQYWGGYTNKRQPPGTVTVHDIVGLCSSAQTGEKVLCVLDDKDGCRYVAVACVSSPSAGVNSCLVQINGPACQDLSIPGNCLYDGTLLTGASGSGDACGYGFTNAGSVWVIDARNCLPKSVKGNERYIACKVADNWTNGSTGRPLWAIVSEASSRLVCVRFEKASSGDDYVNPVGTCIYNGFLVATNNADPCVQTPGEAVWITASVPAGCKVEEKHVSFGIIIKDQHDVGGTVRKLVFAKPQYVCKAVFAQAYSTGNFCSDTQTVGIEGLSVLPTRPRMLPWNIDGDSPTEAGNPYGLAGDPDKLLLLMWDDNAAAPKIIQVEHEKLTVITSISSGGPCKLRYRSADISTMICSESSSQFIDISDAICDCACDQDPPYDPDPGDPECICPATSEDVTAKLSFDMFRIVTGTRVFEGGDPFPGTVLVPYNTSGGTLDIVLEYDPVGESWCRDLLGDPKPGWYGGIGTTTITVNGRLWLCTYIPLGGVDPVDGFALFQCDDPCGIPNPTNSVLQLYNDDQEPVAGSIVEVLFADPAPWWKRTITCYYEYRIFFNCYGAQQSLEARVGRVVPTGPPCWHIGETIGDLVGDDEDFPLQRTGCREANGLFSVYFGNEPGGNGFHAFLGAANPNTDPADVDRFVNVSFEW